MPLTQAQKDAAKARRERIMAAAKKGGYVPQKRVGLGLTIKKVSRTGTTYYYTPWKTLTPEQKRKRIEYGKRYAAEQRRMARAYREEHGMD